MASRFDISTESPLRKVSVANRVIFSDPVFNYTHQTRFLWDEIMIPVTYDSNWRAAAEVMLKGGQQFTESLQDEARAELEEMARKYPRTASQPRRTVPLPYHDGQLDRVNPSVYRQRERAAHPEGSAPRRLAGAV